MVSPAFTVVRYFYLHKNVNFGYTLKTTGCCILKTYRFVTYKKISAHTHGIGIAQFNVPLDILQVTHIHTHTHSF